MLPRRGHVWAFYAQKCAFELHAFIVVRLCCLNSKHETNALLKLVDYLDVTEALDSKGLTLDAHTYIAHRSSHYDCIFITLLA